MKKVLAILFIVITCITLTACGNGSNPTQTPGGQQNPGEQQNPGGIVVTPIKPGGDYEMK